MTSLEVQGRNRVVLEKACSGKQRKVLVDRKAQVLRTLKRVLIKSVLVKGLTFETNCQSSFIGSIPATLFKIDFIKIVSL